MRIHFIALFIYSSWIFSCIPKEPVNGSPVDEAKMISIMTEVYYLDSHFSELNSYIKDSIVYLKFNVILNKYGISKEQFEQAQTYYNDNDKAHNRLIEGIKQKVNEASMK